MNSARQKITDSNFILLTVPDCDQDLSVSLSAAEAHLLIDPDLVQVSLEGGGGEIDITRPLDDSGSIETAKERAIANLLDANEQTDFASGASDQDTIEAANLDFIVATATDTISATSADTIVAADADIIDAAALLDHFIPKALSDNTRTESVQQITSVALLGEEALPSESLVKVVSADLTILDSSVELSDPTSLVRAMNTLLQRLDEVEKEMQSASYTIGYLQAEVEQYKEQLQLLPDFELQSARAVEMGRQNIELRQRLPELELRARQLAEIQQENEELRWQLRELQAHGTIRRASGLTILSLEFWKNLFSLDKKKREDGLVHREELERTSYEKFWRQ